MDINKIVEHSLQVEKSANKIFEISRKIVEENEMLKKKLEESESKIKILTLLTSKDVRHCDKCQSYYLGSAKISHKNNIYKMGNPSTFCMLCIIRIHDDSCSCDREIKFYEDNIIC